MSQPETMRRSSHSPARFDPDGAGRGIVSVASSSVTGARSIPQMRPSPQLSTPRGVLSASWSRVSGRPDQAPPAAPGPGLQPRAARSPASRRTVPGLAPHGPQPLLYRASPSLARYDRLAALASPGGMLHDHEISTHSTLCRILRQNCGPCRAATPNSANRVKAAPLRYRPMPRRAIVMISGLAGPTGGPSACLLTSDSRSLGTKPRVIFPANVRPKRGEPGANLHAPREMCTARLGTLLSTAPRRPIREV